MSQFLIMNLSLDRYIAIYPIGFVSLKNPNTISTTSFLFIALISISKIIIHEQIHSIMYIAGAFTYTRTERFL